MSVQPDLSMRPFQLTVERRLSVSARALFKAWTQEFDRWFAAPGTVLMKPQVDCPFYFAAQFEGKLHPRPSSKGGPRFGKSSVEAPISC